MFSRKQLEQIISRCQLQSEYSNLVSQIYMISERGETPPILLVEEAFFSALKIDAPLTEINTLSSLLATVYQLKTAEEAERDNRI